MEVILIEGCYDLNMRNCPGDRDREREFGSLRESHFPVASISCDGFLQLNEKNFTTLFLTTWVYADENYFL